MQEEAAVRKRLLRQHTNIHRILIAFDTGATGALLAQFGDFASAKRLRDKAVKRGRHRRKPLWAINAQMTGQLVQLIFDWVGGHYLDVGVDQLRRFRAGGDAVPRMSLE